jgi:fumarate hydratase subunit beta
MKIIDLPLSEKIIAELQSGDSLLLNGTIFVARDAAHKRLVAALNRNEVLPFDIEGQVIYYMGPSPARPGNVIGAAGPTTSGRMDSFSALLIRQGLKAMIGKGSRSKEVIDAMVKYHSVYLGAIGGAGALISGTIQKSEVVAYSELGAEAIRKIVVKDFPVTVINDIYGGDLYVEGKARYRQTI